ncbi:polysaccharide lyase beta-sandwich domain-containing protein [Streptomyces sp. CB01580]|uniref:polysaccharide lyase beta-sandwich domain-containing protein n=1 Tax=Streptomyces sp. CB01580 TaxID=1703933 RepID=UPI0009666751|nr:hypothetical protein AMK22_01485 [Streptomyces sp. CB01580]
MELSRRNLIAAGGATAVTALMTSAGTARAHPVTAPASAGAGADLGFDALLQRAETLLTGRGFDPDDPDFTAAVAALDATARGLWDTLDRSAGRTAPWPEQRTGTWRTINSGADTGGSTDPVTRRYLTLRIDHGVSPVDAGYAYVLLPGASAAATSVWSRSMPVRIVADDATAQAVEVRRSGLVAAQFWAAGSAAGITASGPASVLVRRRGARIGVAVADPGRTLTTVSVELPFRTKSVAQKDDTVHVLPGRRTVLTVAVGGSRGHTHRAELVR